MNDEEENPASHRVLEQRARRRELNEALRAIFPAVATDDRFEELLKRLDDSEPTKQD
ncbi:hypothetical protein [Phyllobacterium endophyticum]|uniref:hypothetical protein n=1 Tax=Phyllobacterium endophyticum TaxID=1149773 RepID=UPI0014738282|nr:hypothetical protein [Phyllobacterium endophyticum]MBB3237383.1 hypothetical protein [Phyllobacterium endophyticum]